MSLIPSVSSGKVVLVDRFDQAVELTLGVEVGVIGINAKEDFELRVAQGDEIDRGIPPVGFLSSSRIGEGK